MARYGRTGEGRLLAMKEEKENQLTAQKGSCKEQTVNEAKSVGAE